MEKSKIILNSIFYVILTAIFIYIFVKEKALKQNQRFLNQVVDVLVDGPSKRDETMMTGYTAHQKLINFKGRKEDIGKIVPVKVTEVKTWALKGEQVD